MATTATALMTAEELARIPDDGYHYELVRGVLRKMSPASFRPSSGKAGTPIVITGENLTAVTGVEFTKANAPDFKIVSEQQLNVSVPKGAATGPITLHAGQEHVASGEDFTVTKWLPGRAKSRGG